MTFLDYLKQRRVTDTPAGDFTSDARSDKKMPDVSTWADLRTYLERRVGIDMQDKVIPAAREVWKGYQTALRRRADQGE